jgi:hypothetical protein
MDPLIQRFLWQIDRRMLTKRRSISYIKPFGDGLIFEKLNDAGLWPSPDRQLPLHHSFLSRWRPRVPKGRL